MARKYTQAYKKRILAELDAAEKGEKGVILRREGLYSSTVCRWRKQREASCLAGKKRGPKSDEAQRELKRLREEKARLEERLKTTEELVEAQGIVSAYVGDLGQGGVSSRVSRMVW